MARKKCFYTISRISHGAEFWPVITRDNLCNLGDGCKEPSNSMYVLIFKSQARPAGNVNSGVAQWLSPCLSFGTPGFNSRLLPLRPLSKVLTYACFLGHISMVPQLAKLNSLSVKHGFM